MELDAEQLFYGLLVMIVIVVTFIVVRSFWDKKGP